MWPEEARSNWIQKIMKYMKAKVFKYYECHPSEVKEEWSKCIISIDEKSHALKKLKGIKTKKENLPTDTPPLVIV